MKVNQQTYLIGNVYSVGRKIGAGNFGELHLGRNVHTNESVAIKLEQTKAKTPQLVFEFRYYKMLNPQEGIPNAHYYGQYNKYNALVLDLLGPNIEELFDMCGRKFTTKTVAMFTMQAVRRLEYVHGKQLIYRDMKPENFCIGRQTYQSIRTVFLVDFGLAKRYIDPETNLHIPFKDHKSLTGTARYMSVNTHLGYEQSRRDDLEALGNVAMYLMRGSLPWQGLKADTLKERYQKIGETKQKTTIEELCKNHPPQMSTYFKYVRSLSFAATPDYSYLYDLMHEILKDKKLDLDWEFDWLVKRAVCFDWSKFIFHFIFNFW
ncbi:hypothetical protein HELRODRAFT_63981 [Helobdella robusta]|uniref:non-specific serine/threonine protein kinase n=1 Tax=Helobdella robusta TaxID=6412 RepID=T1FXN2_HELRO|nr:hypothetical protein HELRODRAFT_63981 [Helobdella robusta]ESO06674.1 hypothetical protein HELRODRAFT_63981 [Helobdella robusta]